jgi:hypothetical protein
MQQHPINCVDFVQSSDACKYWSKRLPSEEEWEFAARGGSEERTYSWGATLPDETLSCYSHPGTCKVGEYAAGAFGLFDMTGNVWEWTDSRFLTVNGWNIPDEWRVYRGGSYSRRFPKWMKTWVRNRYRPNEWGAHLGFRCAKSLDHQPCPVGSHVGPDDSCLIDDSSPPAESVSSAALQSKPAMASASSLSPSLSASVSSQPSGNAPLTVSRDSQFDDDCQRYKKRRPIAFRILGGDFATRQRKKTALGCANRDVGVGFNSVCCPKAMPDAPSTLPAASNSASVVPEL